MHPDQLKAHLSKMNQSEILKTLKSEVANADRLKAKTDKAEAAELTGLFGKRKLANSWSNSEQYEKSKEAIRIIVKFLI